MNIIKKGIIVFVAVLIIGAVVAGGITMFFHTYTHDDYGLCVNGTEVDDVELTIQCRFQRGHYNFPYFVAEYNENAKIPLLLLFEKLGGSVEWTNENNAVLTLNGKVYDLHFSYEPALISRETEQDLFNFIILGDLDHLPYFYEKTDTELYYGSNYLWHIFEGMGLEVDFNINKMTKTVEVRSSLLENNQE